MEGWNEMASMDQLISQIRFQLEQLSARNAHHDFEHLCRHLARERICSNILPATGPVTAGGDQGRDFETFRSLLSSNTLVDSMFLGLTSNKRIVFACSLQKSIVAKIKSDIQTIVSSGSSIDMIYFLCSTDVPVAKRHELVQWANGNYSVELEILDGQAISELLIGRDIFWIAARYLNIPSEIYPREPQYEDHAWYYENKARWETKPVQNRYSFADFVEIKAAARHVLDTEELRIDLLFWISLLSNLAQVESPFLRSRAIYEVAVVSLRGLGTLNGLEEQLRSYFSDIPHLESTSDLQDTSILITYCIGASFENRTQLHQEEFINWKQQLVNRVEEKLTLDVSTGQRCSLLETRGYLCMIPDPLKIEEPEFDEALHWWLQLVELIEDAPLFPLESFVDALVKFIHFLGDEPKYEVLTEKLDVLLSQRVGGFTAAQKCRDRAVAFYNNGKILKAINQLHHSKIQWLAEETLSSSLAVMIFISFCYSKLGLTYAGKYYALSAAYISLHSPELNNKDIISKALLTVAEMDYTQGSWYGFLSFSEIALKAHSLFEKKPGDLSEHDELQPLIYHLSMVKVITERIDPNLFGIVKGLINKWGIESWLQELYFFARNEWKDESIETLWNNILAQLGGRPFGDLGMTRETSWSQLGIAWNINWENDFETTAIAEQIIASLQIFLADLSEYDLLLLKTEVEITVSIKDIKEPDIRAVPSNEGRKWIINFPRQDDDLDIDGLTTEIISMSSLLLRKVSLLPNNQFFEIIEKSFQQGMSMKIFVGRPYQEVYKQFVKESDYDASHRKSLKVPYLEKPYLPEEHKSLGWKDDLDPGYSKDSSESLIKKRYANVMPPIRYTLKRLVSDQSFIEIVLRLRSRGWKDWHILSSILNITVNYRINQRRDIRNNPQMLGNLFQKMVNMKEELHAITVPISEFTEEKMISHQRFNMLSTLKVLGLECQQETPDLIAIDHFLSVRYRYWEDDIEHEDPFVH